VVVEAVVVGSVVGAVVVDEPSPARLA